MMHEVSYAGGKFVTSDEVAEALIEYAAALANADRAETIDIPASGLPASEGALQLLVGPASQLMSSPVAHDDADDDGVAGTVQFVEEIRRRIERLQRGWSGPSGSSAIDWDL